MHEASLNGKILNGIGSQAALKISIIQATADHLMLSDEALAGVAVVT
jgi:hypothetical protein